MTTHSDFLIGRIALERGLISVDQLAECLADQKGASAATLGALMLRKGLIKQRDLDTLLEEQKKRLASALDLTDPKLEDALLGRLLIKQGLVKEAQLYECLRASAEIGEKGEKPPRLGELLVRKGYLTTDAVDRVLPTSRKDRFLCPKCGTQFSSMGGDESRFPTCKQCGAVLERRERSGRPGETTETMKVDFPEDAAKVAKDPARQFAGGKYLLVQEVGHGGMGVVWKAWQTDLRRYVAVKILLGTMWTDVELKRFYREAQLAASLSHPNIASIYELGVHDGKHFMVMEFVEGDSVARLMTPTSNKQGTQRAVRVLPTRRGIEILRDAALAVDYAHTKKIIHRDLKPHNIMVQKADGRVFVMDFGLAKPIRKEDSITLSDAIVGTPQYMSPEQARGDTVDRRTDVFSLGAVLYHVLTNRPPFDGHSPGEIMMSVLADDPAPMRKLNPRIHEDVETICLKALDKDRSRRYDTAKAFADDLSRHLDGEPITARPLSTRERAWKEMRRRPLPMALILASTGAIVLISIIFTIQYLQTRAKIEEFAREAHDAEAQGKYDQAKTWWDKILTLSPEDAVALEQWRHCDELAENPARTLRELQDLQRRFIKASHQEADALLKAGKYQRALGLTLKILAFDPNDGEALRRQKFCEAALADEEQKTEALIARKDTELTEQQQKEKELRRQRLMRINAFPDYHRARELAEEAKGMRLQDEAGTGFTIADVQEKYREARKALTSALETDKTYAEAQYFRGQIRHRLGEFDFAENDFKEAWDYSSDSIPVALAAAMSQLAIFTLHEHVIPELRDAKGRDAALVRMESWARKIEKTPKPQSAFEHWMGKALIEFREARYAAAAESLGYIQRESRANYFFHFLNACIHSALGNWRAAQQDLGSALELEPTALESRYLRTVVRIHTEDLTNALSDAKKSVEIAPRGPFTWFIYVLRAQVNHELRLTEEAVADLATAGSFAGPMAGAVNTLRNRWVRAPRAEK
ncbi:MAG TPA: protein kinase [Planctomycetota bacterium]|nr:protein kinase [Planctomycetota bacterium]